MKILKKLRFCSQVRLKTGPYMLKADESLSNKILHPNVEKILFKENMKENRKLKKQLHSDGAQLDDMVQRE